MSDSTIGPNDGLSLEARLFVEWLRRGSRTTVREARKQLQAMDDSGRGRDGKALWNELFSALFDEWVAEIRREVSGDVLPDIARMILGEQAAEAPDAKQSLKEQIRGLREKIALAAGEDEEFTPDLSEISRALATYEEVLEEFGDDPRLDEVVRRGVKQALVVKQRDLAWLEALLERERSAAQADARDSEQA